MNIWNRQISNNDVALILITTYQIYSLVKWGFLCEFLSDKCYDANLLI